MWIITKASRDSNTPYQGPACQSAGVEPGKYYDSEAEALTDAAKLSQVNPVGFVVKKAPKIYTHTDYLTDVAIAEFRYAQRTGDTSYFDK